MVFSFMLHVGVVWPMTEIDISKNGAALHGRRARPHAVLRAAADVVAIRPRGQHRHAQGWRRATGDARRARRRQLAKAFAGSTRGDGPALRTLCLGLGRAPTPAETGVAKANPSSTMGDGPMTPASPESRPSRTPPVTPERAAAASTMASTWIIRTYSH